MDNSWIAISLKVWDPFFCAVFLPLYFSNPVSIRAHLAMALENA